MAAPIEARSLSSLTTLASNPPRYPRNPTETTQPSLVLYIARVPGSRDVFLTPMKPRDKVVTAEDVQSSLYYLHVDQPHDQAVLDRHKAVSEHEGIEEQEPDGGERGSPIRRRPLPPLPSSMEQLERQGGPPPYNRASSRSPQKSSSPIRKPTAMSPLSPRLDVSSRHNIDAATVARKPIGPSPVAHLGSTSTGIVSLNRENVSPDVQIHSHSMHPLHTKPAWSPRGLSTQDMGTHSNNRRNTDGFHALRSSSISSLQNQQPRSAEQSKAGDTPNDNNSEALNRLLETSLTLIRRDPTSGAQWNVAKIRDPPVLDVSSESTKSQRLKRAGAPLFIDVYNPGYTKFIVPVESRPSPRFSVAAFPTESQPSDAGKANIFQRRLWTDGSRFADHSYGHRKTSSNSSNGSSSGNDGVSASIGRRSRELQATSAPSMDKRSRGYAFLSPWNGRCEFSTGGAGRSLKCKHSLQRGDQASLPSMSTTVSELRFNLPGSNLLSFPPTAIDDGNSSKRSSFFARPRVRKNLSSSSTFSASLATPVGIINDDKLDLSLGKEHAGGGFGGKQAKLGKLIIEDEGLKMLDLLVAANMSLWWRAYERTELGLGGYQEEEQSIEGF